MSRLFPCLSCQQGEGTADTQSGATTGPGGVRAVPAASVAMEVPGRECHSPPGSAGIESPATAAADSQHTQKVQGEDQGETPCALGKLAEQALREVFYGEVVYEPGFSPLPTLRKALKPLT